MASYGITKGTPDWDVPLNADLSDIDTRITSNTSLITSLQGTQATQGGQINALQTSVSQNSADIVTNTNSINSLNTSVSTLQGQVATNTSNIATNTTNISTNTTNITTLQGQVSTNTTQIAQRVTIDSQVINVKDHGAIGDGVNDDASGIATALGLLTNGGTLYFPPGTYLVNSGSSLAVNKAVQITGAGPGASSIRIGASFAQAQLFNVTSDDVTFQDIQIRGVSTTVTSNPVADGILATAVQTFKMFNVEMQYINGYAVKVFASAASTIHGGQIDNIKIQSCAGGIYIKGDNASGNVAANFQLSNVFTRFLGLNSGGSANLDGIRIEDAWDVLGQNLIAWMNASTGGTGSAFRVIGNVAATFIQNLDALGPQTGAANVAIQGNANGDPQNVQINGGVIQQGQVGILVAGASNQVRVRGVRIINNQTHGVSVTSTGYAIYFDECLLSLNGAGATGTNYDFNWSGTATGYITDCRIGSNITSVGVAGVQTSINVTAGQNVRVINADFSGSGSASTNWYTALPQTVSRNDGSNVEIIGNTDMRLPTNTRLSMRAVAAGNNAIAFNVNGGDAVDRARILGDGTLNYGDGTNPRDTTWGRRGAAIIGTSDSDIEISTVGKGLRVKGGTNGRVGTATLAAGTVTVTVPSITANSRVMITRRTSGGTVGTLTYTISAGSGFTVNSSSGTDTSVVDYFIVEQI